MSGVRNGVQALIKQEEGRALYVHCLAHSVNLCVHDVTKKCVIVRNVMDFIYKLVQLIKFSPKRLHVFESLKRVLLLVAETQLHVKGHFVLLDGWFGILQ
jgi:hypothetical protein